MGTAIAKRNAQQLRCIARIDAQRSRRSVQPCRCSVSAGSSAVVNSQQLSVATPAVSAQRSSSGNRISNASSFAASSSVSAFISLSTSHLVSVVPPPASRIVSPAVGSVASPGRQNCITKIISRHRGQGCFRPQGTSRAWYDPQLRTPTQHYSMADTHIRQHGLLHDSNSRTHTVQQQSE